MKIYISIDMEGITGIVHGEQLGPEGKDYAAGRKLYMHDLQAAIDGAFDAGVEEILVNDAHGTMRNILIEDLDERMGVFPDEYVAIIQTAETSGRLDDASMRLADRYREEAEHAIKVLITIGSFLIWACVAAFVIAMIFWIFARFYVGAIKSVGAM